MCFLPWPGQHMMPTEQMLQGNRISPHLISAFSPTQEFKDTFESFLIQNTITPKVIVLQDMSLVVLPVRRRGAELSLGPALLLLFLGKTWPGNETLWGSPWEPPGPRPW